MNLSAVTIGALGLVAASLLVWLPVRIFNRGWRDKKTCLGIGLLLALLSYPAMLGPCCWISSRTGWGRDIVTAAYRPLLGRRTIGPLGSKRGYTIIDEPLPAPLTWYAESGAKDGWHWTADITFPTTEPEDLPRGTYQLTVQWDWDSDDDRAARIAAAIAKQKSSTR